MAFTTSAAFYEALANAPYRLEREGPLLRETLEAAPGRRVLDLACGTGIHALFFAQEGAEVTAADLSAEMVAHAAHLRPHRAVRHLVGDMRRLPDGEWDLIVCLGNSLCLVTESTDLLTVYREAAAHLAPGGRFLTQTLNYARPAAREPRHRVEQAQYEGNDIIAIKSLVPHGDRTLLTLAFFADEDGVMSTVSESAVLQNWSVDDLQQAAVIAGLEPEACYGGYDKRPFEEGTSPDVLLTVGRPA